MRLFSPLTIHDPVLLYAAYNPGSGNSTDVTELLINRKTKAIMSPKLILYVGGGRFESRTREFIDTEIFRH
jgi:hypothetical protein